MEPPFYYPTQLQTRPNIEIRDQGYHTIIMMDDTINMLHWAVDNIPDSRISEGRTLVAYIPPNPPRQTPSYTYNVPALTRPATQGVPLNTISIPGYKPAGTLSVADILAGRAYQPQAYQTYTGPSEHIYTIYIYKQPQLHTGSWGQIDRKNFPLENVVRTNNLQLLDKITIRSGWTAGTPASGTYRVPLGERVGSPVRTPAPQPSSIPPVQSASTPSVQSTTSQSTSGPTLYAYDPQGTSGPVLWTKSQPQHPEHKHLSDEERAKLFIPGNPLNVQQQKYCHATLEIAAKNNAECNEERNWGPGKECYNPYAVAASRLHTSYRHCAEYYDYTKLRDDELQAFADLEGIPKPIPYTRDAMLDAIRDWQIRTGKVPTA